MLPLATPPHRNGLRGPWRIETSPTTAHGSSGDGCRNPQQPSSYSSPPSPRSSPPLTPPDSTEEAIGADVDKLKQSQQQQPTGHLLPGLFAPLSPGSHLPSLSATSSSSSSSSSTAGPSTLQRTKTIKSRNDIFASTPAPLSARRPPPSAVAMSRFSTYQDQNSPSASPSQGSRNTLFFDTQSSSPGFSIRRGEWQSSRDSVTGKITQDSVPQSDPDIATDAAAEYTRRLSLGRSSVAERERERSRIRQSKEIDFRLAPSKEYLLGEGRHCDVFLGAYRRRRVDSDDGEPASDWHLCAIKRLHPDRQSQLLGLDEAFALRRLGPHPGVVKLIDIRDEVLAATSPMPTASIELRSIDSAALEADSTLASDKGILSSSPQHSRSTSHPWTHRESKSLAHNRLNSEPDTPNPWADLPHTAKVRSGSEKEPSTSGAALPSQQIGCSDIHRSVTDQSLASLSVAPTSVSCSSTDPPRLLILLELLPLNLATYSRRHSSSIDIFFWLRCACELASTLEWMHGKGCVHCDIKPENILLDHTLRTKLCDFNSAFFPSASTAPLTDGVGLGTPAYGAPELTKRGKSGDIVSFPVDVFSLGALLYSLATGFEPMARAKSMMEMLHRKERFFLTEENDRIARTSVAEGWGDSSSNAGSANASRHSSLRRRQTESSPANSALKKRPSHRRDSSADSGISTTSSITTLGGKTPSVAAIRLLLEPSSMAGLLVPPTPDRRRVGPSTVSDSQHHRALSLHKNYASNKNAAKHALPMAGQSMTVDLTRNDELSATGTVDHLDSLRPFVLRRTTSYGGVMENGETGPPQSTTLRKDEPTDLSLALSASFAEIGREKSRLEGEELRNGVIALNAAKAGRSHHPPTKSTAPSTPPSMCRASHLDLTTTPLTSSQNRLVGSGSNEEEAQTEEGEVEEEEEGEDRSPYRDGSPALILPGGGKLPQAALDLLEHMLLANPLRRPKASEVKRRLEAILEETMRALS